MTTILRISRPSGLVERFIADSCEIAGGMVTATGRWRRPSGRFSDVGSYSWPVKKVHEIQWPDRDAAERRAA